MEEAQHAPFARSSGPAIHPETEVLTRGFDPRLSAGSVRPAVFRSSTFVFSSPEAAELSFAAALGKHERAPNEEAELIYARLSHPDATRN